MKEEWKRVAGVSGHYLVSNTGKVMSKNRAKPVMMNPIITEAGYKRVCLLFGHKTKHKTVHRLVALAFCDGYADGLQVNHKDGNKKNNLFTNLEWVSPMENTHHAWAHGLFNSRGERNCKAKLTDSEVIAIRNISRLADISYSKIGKVFGVHEETIRKIVIKQIWRHI